MCSDIIYKWKEQVVLVDSLSVLGWFDDTPEYIAPTQVKIIVQILSKEFDRAQRMIKTDHRRTYKNKNLKAT